jgi:hypothetical protein
MFADETVPLVVAHPLLAAIFRNRRRLVYQHGEVVAPRESWVKGLGKIVVPTADTANVFRDAGISDERLFISGLCIEPGLVAEAEYAFCDRIDRLNGSTPLCGAFFSSGAEPTAHVNSIAAAATSVHRRGGGAIVFARIAGSLERRMKSVYAASGFDLTKVDATVGVTKGFSGTLLCPYTDRKDLNARTAKLFEKFDYFVAPSHERTNWALGLGLPMYVVDPPFGSFAPLNREVLLGAGVAKTIKGRSEAAQLAETLEAHRKSGEIRRMSEAGWQRFDIRGFANIAGWLESEYCA